MLTNGVFVVVVGVHVVWFIGRLVGGDVRMCFLLLALCCVLCVGILVPPDRAMLM